MGKKIHKETKILFCEECDQTHQNDLMIAGRKDARARQMKKYPANVALIMLMVDVDR